MKPDLRIILFAAILSAGGAALPEARAATETIQQDIVMDIDRLGDGTLTIDFRLSASQWTIWKQQYGDRPDVLWRDLRQQFAAYVLGDFSLEKNDVERCATAKLRIRGGTKLRSDGMHEIEVPKDMKKVTGSGREWIFSSVVQAAANAPILTATIRLLLPAEAAHTRLNQPGTPYQSIVYEIPSAVQSKGFLAAGLGALLLGVALGAATCFAPRKPGPPAGE